MAIEAVGRTTPAIATSSGRGEGGEVGGSVVVLCLATGASSLWLQLLIPDAKM